jgi:hypothetical protein
MNRYVSIAALLCATVVSSCSKDGVQSIASPATSGAFVRFFNFGVNAPGVNFYANDAKLTAISSTTGTESTTGTAYGAAAANALYSSIAPGQYTLTGKIAAATDKDLVVSTVAAPLADGKYYSYFVSGIYNTTSKTVEAFLIEDAFPATIDYTVAHVRFVNAVSNSTPTILYGRNTSATTPEAAIGGAVAYKTGGAFIAVAPGVYDLAVRVPGSSTNVTTATAQSLNAGRVYTLILRGDMTATGTAANRPLLSGAISR